VTVVYVLAGIAVALLLAELLLPTGGFLAVLGASGLVASGIVALSSDTSAADGIGAALITGGVLSLISFVFIARKVARSHHEQPVRGGKEGLIGALAEVRVPLDPVGQVFTGGALWRARATEPGVKVDAGARVRVESVDGLTLLVEPVTEPANKEGN